ncbi:acetamidase [Aspergillus udagawae]|uniref:amidase n=1 Tax=Aspergillus udagawae TaxID=91492 RepID=A0ABQ1ACV8_9EURO|nr:acetamidase [Aspergillus udagawae]GFF79101.1 acetamidase [Aspergillus udagawae]
MALQDSLADWQHKVAQKQQECLQKIPAEWKIPESLLSSLRLPLAENKNDLIQGDTVRKSGILTERELQITEQYTVSGLLSALAEGRLTSLEVTLAFSKRAAVAQQLVNCLTETMFPEAQERAKYLDDLKAQGKSSGPLHGLPISIKDLFHVKGTHASIGMISFLDERSTDNSPLVDILLSLGAVIYVKTNIPQTMMTADSHNNVFGRTLNPHNTLLGPGGSSGGEGALIALRGSPLGVGTDIGGSIRIPALCCGTYGFRPSASRIPNGGGRSCSTPGMKFILSCAGPLALDMDAIEVFLKTVIDARPGLYDSSVIDVPWRTATVRHPLRIGVVPPDSIFPLHPPVRRTLAEAASLLRAQGHQIIELSAEECKVMEINEVAWNIFTLDSGAMEHLQAAGEPPVPALIHIKRQVEILKQAGKTSLPDFSHVDRLGKLAALNAKRADLRETWRKMWNSHDLDICLAPSAQNTAVPHDMFGLAPYTTFLNCLDYPSCIIPFGQVNETDAQEAFELSPGQTGPTYNFAQLEGAPCSIQVFTTTMRDEECLEMARIIDKCLKSKA